MGNPRQEKTGELRKALVRIAELEKRNEYLEAALSGLLTAEDAMASAQEFKQAGLKEVRAALGAGKPPKRF